MDDLQPMNPTKPQPSQKPVLIRGQHVGEERLGMAGRSMPCHWEQSRRDSREKR